MAVESNQAAGTASRDITLQRDQPRRRRTIGGDKPPLAIEAEAVARRCHRARGAVHKQRRTVAAQPDHAGFIAIDDRFERLAAHFTL